MEHRLKSELTELVVIYFLEHISLYSDLVELGHQRAFNIHLPYRNMAYLERMQAFVYLHFFKSVLINVLA